MIKDHNGVTEAAFTRTDAVLFVTGIFSAPVMPVQEQWKKLMKPYRVSTDPELEVEIKKKNNNNNDIDQKMVLTRLISINGLASQLP